MVPVEHIVSLRERLLSNPKINQFDKFIKGEKFETLDEAANSATDKSYIEFLSAIAINDRNAFNSAYSEFSRKKPSIDTSPWVNNDYLIFAIVVGVELFSLDKKWIQDVLKVRRSGNQEQQLLTTTFRNILEGNILSNDNLHSVVVVFLDLMKRPQLDKPLLDSVYRSLTETELLNSNNDFLVVTGLRAYNIVILSKDTIDSEELLRLRAFEVEFLRRTEWLNTGFSVLCIGCMLFFGVKLYREYETVKGMVSDYGALFQILGIGIVGSGLALRRKLLWSLRFLLGFKEKLS